MFLIDNLWNGQFFWISELYVTISTNIADLYELFQNRLIMILFFKFFSYITDVSIIYIDWLIMVLESWTDILIITHIYLLFLLFLIIFFTFFFVNYLGFYGVFILNIGGVFLFWLLTIPTYLYLYIYDLTIIVNVGKWFWIPHGLLVYFEFLYDSLSLSYIFLTSTIAVSAIGYIFIYFRYEPLVDRLILLITAFVASMILLVSASNLIMLFLGWELIGLTSFFLINFWSTRVATLKSAFKAFTFNKFSDLSLLIAILYIYNEMYTIDIVVIVDTIMWYDLHQFELWNFNITYHTFVSTFFILCAFVKSAQFGFHIWLPDSMEAPVPASALIHSATLVSAGIFLILRFPTLFEGSYYNSWLFVFFGSITALVGGLCAVFQSDTKRLLAYSTISHCGFLFLTLTTFMYEYTLIYLYIHGLFKACSFLCVGNIIRFSNGYQDFRRMGNLCTYLPFEFKLLTLSLFNLGGLPLSLGFFSKHFLLLGVNFVFYSNTLFFLNFIISAGCGFFYSYRLVYNVFFDFKKISKTTFSTFFSTQNSNYIGLQFLTSTATFFAKWCISFLFYSAYFLIIFILSILVYQLDFYTQIFYTIHYFLQNFDVFFSSLSLLNNLWYINISFVLIFCSISFSLFRFTFFWKNFFFEKIFFLICVIFFF